MRTLLGALVVPCVLALIAPAMATAGSISGTVTDEGSNTGIAGIEVCLHPEPYAFEGPCTKTDASGNYVLNDLPATSYHVGFSAWPEELNYVQEWYPEDQSYPGELVMIGETEVRTGIDAELEAGGVIKGTATDATTAGPAVGVWVCVEAFEPVFYGSCRRADSAGEYERNDLPTGEYRIAFEGWNHVNYLSRYYDEEDQFGQATKVPVTAGETVSGINATLQPGAQILGTVTEAHTGIPLDDVEVCLYRPSISLPPEYVDRCTRTDTSGNYALRSLPAETYKVVFSREGGGWDEDSFREQWWLGVSSHLEATPLTVAPPDEIKGIDAQLVDLWPEPGGGSVLGASWNATTTSPPPPLAAKGALRKCKKGFHRKLVKGKRRCVRKHKPRKQGQQRKGRGAGKARG